MGKGQFILSLARDNPHINYIGIERYNGGGYMNSVIEKLAEIEAAAEAVVERAGEQKAEIRDAPHPCDSLEVPL